MAVRVRRIEPGEGKLLREVRLAALADTPGAFASRFEDEVVRADEAWEAAAARSRGFDTANFFAESDERIVGLVGAYRSAEEPATIELVSMWVSPDARGRGIGAQLVERVSEWAREGDARRVALWVMRGNEGAASLYQRTGFAAADLPAALASHPCHDETRMVLDLDPTREVGGQFATPSVITPPTDPAGSRRRAGG
jgi:GNAT superfamily N-acetyltransferase